MERNTVVMYQYFILHVINAVNGDIRRTMNQRNIGGIATSVIMFGKHLNKHQDIYMASSKTTVVAIRLPNDVVFTLRRRIKNRRSRWLTVGEYLRERVIYDTMRKHGD